MSRVFTRAAVIGAITVLALASSASAQTLMLVDEYVPWATMVLEWVER